MEGYWLPVACLLVSQVLALEWSSCGDEKDTIQLAHLTITPEVLHIPGAVTINALGKLRENITEPIKVELEVQKKMFWGYVHIPCEDGFGSCTYDDICTFSPYTEECPQIYNKYNIPCKCPIKQGKYSVKGLTVHVERIHIPKFLVGGKYKIHASISSQGHEVGCYDIKVSIK